MGLMSDKIGKRAVLMGPYIFCSAVIIFICIFVKADMLGPNAAIFIGIGYFLGGPYNVC